MTNFKKIWLCAGVNFSKWSVNPRFFSIGAVILAYMIWIFSWISDYASAVNVNTSPWVFPYLMTTPIILLIYGGLTTLFYSDAPFWDNHSSFLVIRTSRRNWISGQLLYIITSSFLYSLFFVLSSVIALIPNVSFSAEWGPVLKTLAFDPGSPDKYGITPYVVISDPVISQFTAIQAMLISFGLFWLTSIFIGALILLFNILVGKMSGLIAAGFFTALAYFSVYVGKFSYGNIIYFLSPINWVSMFYLDWGQTHSLPSPIYCVSILLGGIVVMFSMSIFLFCKRDINI